jgi:hypothetical protein
MYTMRSFRTISYKLFVHLVRPSALVITAYILFRRLSTMATVSKSTTSNVSVHSLLSDRWHHPNGH